MKIYKFLADCDRLTLLEKTSAGGFSGNCGTYRCEFSFSEEWDSLRRFAVFITTSKTYTVEIEDGACNVPFEAAERPGTVHIGVFGSDGSGKILSSSLLPLYISEGAYREGETPEAVTPSVWEKYYAEITKVGGYADRAETAAESAKAAKEGAESAKDGAQAAKSAAEGFSSAASESKSAAAQSAQDAQKSAQSAQAAKSAAENAKNEAESAKSGAEAAQSGAETAKNDIEGKLADYETHEEAQELYEQLQNEMWNGFYPRTVVDNLFSNVYTKSEVDEKDTALNNGFSAADEQLWLEVVKKANDSDLIALKKTSAADLAALKKKALPRGAVSGYPAVLKNALADETLIGLKVYGNHGKNLLSYPFYGKTATINGVTFTDNGDGSVTANGTATANTPYFVKFRKLFTPEQKKYALSGCPTGGGTSSYLIGFDLYNGETGVRWFKDSGNGVTFDLSSLTFTGASIYIHIIKGTTVDNLVFKPQLEEGDAVSEYEPYKTVGYFDSASGKYLLPVYLSVEGNPLEDLKSTAYLDTPLDGGEYVDFIAKKRYSASGKTSDITVEGEITSVADDRANTIISTTDVPPKKIEAEYFLDISKELAEIKAAILSQGGNV